MSTHDTCEACGGRVPSDAIKCPHCGSTELRAASSVRPVPTERQPASSGPDVTAIAMGGGVRVGLEDNLWLDHPQRQHPASNVSLVSRVKEIAALHDRPVMSPLDMRKMLDLPTK